MRRITSLMPISSMSSVEMILKPTVSSSVEIGLAAHLASDTGVYARVRQKSLFMRDVEKNSRA